MKQLLDENLSPRLVSRLAELFGEIVHVRDVGLREADDRTIWNWAKSNGHLVVTADADSLLSAGNYGFCRRWFTLSSVTSRTVLSRNCFVGTPSGLQSSTTIK